MNMKGHILIALREQYYRWEGLLGKLDETQIQAPLNPSDWSTKDVMVHLWAWQQRTIARVVAVLTNHEPQFPDWLPGLDPETEDVSQLNDWIFNTYRGRSWRDVYQDWKTGFLNLLDSSQGISEHDLLDSGKYPWLGGYPLVLYLIGTYDHHREHYDELFAWLQENKV